MSRQGMAWFRSRWARFDGPARRPGVDLARGVAMVGMFAAHMVDLPAFRWSDPATWTDLVNGRSSILFAMLAGVSIALTTGGARGIDGDRVGTARGRLAVRAVCIWVIGLLLMLMPVPIVVILPAYAILFLLAIPAIRLPAGVLFVMAGAIALIAPFAVHAIDEASFWQTEGGQALDGLTGWNYPFLLWAAFLAAGMGIGRLPSAPKIAAALFGAGTLLVVLGYAVIAPLADAPAWLPALSGDPHSSGLGEAIGSGGFAIAVIGLSVLLCATPLRWLAIPLRAIGSMPLTAYAAQFVVWTLVTGDQPNPFVFRDLHPFWPVTIGIVACCTAWTLLIGRGPLEAAVAGLSRVMVPGGSVR